MGTTEPPSSRSSGGVDLVPLEQERQFLLRSLADLDAEFDAGDIEEDDYRSLTDDYTARTAAVLKAIEAVTTPGQRSSLSRPGPPASPARQVVVASHLRPAARPPAQPAPNRTTRRAAAAAARARAVGAGAESGEDVGGAPLDGSSRLPLVLASRRRWRNAAVIAAVVLFGGVAVWAVTESTGARQPGQTITGNAQTTANTSTTVAAGVDPRLAEAVNDANKGQYFQAVQLYSAILKDDPNQPVALADQGWLEAQIGLEGNQPSLVTTGMASIVKAEKADPSYAEPYFFRGDVLLHDNNAPEAVTEFRTFLGLADPSDPNIPTAQSLLQQAIKAAGPNVPPGPNAATATTQPTSTTSKP